MKTSEVGASKSAGDQEKDILEKLFFLVRDMSACKLTVQLVALKRRDGIWFFFRTCMTLFCCFLQIAAPPAQKFITNDISCLAMTHFPFSAKREALFICTWQTFIWRLKGSLRADWITILVVTTATWLITLPRVLRSLHWSVLVTWHNLFLKRNNHGGRCSTHTSFWRSRPELHESWSGGNLQCTLTLSKTTVKA